ncbi:sugar ABC transporter [Leifsonia sp. LS1]|nr:sugar ABC transporter [Leifsonia sp. LS1]
MSGCSPTSTPKATDTSSPGNGAGTIEQITWANTNFGDPTEGPKLQAMIDSFNSSHPTIHVSEANIPFPTFDQTVITQLAGGAGPDVIRWDTPGFFQAAKAGLLTPLTNTIDAKKLGLRPAPDKYTIVNGVRYGVVEGETPYMLLYNKSIIQTPPTNFEQFLATAKAATKNGVYGFGVRTTLPQAPGMWQDLCNYVFGFGGDWSNGHKLTINSANVIKGLNAYKQVVDAGVIPKGATASTYRSMMYAGKLAMEIDAGGIADNAASAKPPVLLGGAPIPFPVKKVGEILSMDAVSGTTKHKQAAETFLKWLLTPAAQHMILDASSTGTSVATNVKLTSAELAAKPLTSVFAKAGQSAEPQVIRGYEGQTDAISLAIVTKVIAALQGEDMQKAMDEAQQQAATIIANG